MWEKAIGNSKFLYFSNTNCIHFRCIMWCFDKCIHCEMITILKVITIPITSHNYRKRSTLLANCPHMILILMFWCLISSQVAHVLKMNYWCCVSVRGKGHKVCTGRTGRFVHRSHGSISINFLAWHYTAHFPLDPFLIVFVFLRKHDWIRTIPNHCEK